MPKVNLIYNALINEDVEIKSPRGAEAVNIA